ncbi:hypothetical protein PIB30_040182 [Stylosanthes scabra]|uniref:RNase H type-1 domain-containing protein n=1 Tax=Stylosanthes scabra TaxID=79078 RepID=A0ABU6YH19_9FABA|nr:hypothetical protein [Stylosanthes scabra]
MKLAHVIFRANLSEADFTSNQQKSTRETFQQRNNRTVVTWNPPHIGQVKCNTDGEHRSTGAGATVAVFCNAEGKVLTVTTIKQQSSTNRNWCQDFPTVIEGIIRNEEEITRSLSRNNDMTQI